MTVLAEPVVLTDSEPAEGATKASPSPAALEPPVLAPGRSRVARAVTAVGWSLVGIAIVLAVWAFAASGNPKLPSPGDTFTELRELLSDPFHDRGPNDKGIFIVLLGSLQRVFYGFGLATLVGVPLGLFIGTSKRAWRAANPVIQFLRPVSPLAWFPIALTIIPDAPRAAVWVIFITALWPTVINTAVGAGMVPVDHRNVARVFHFGRFAYLRHILIPNVLPHTVTGLRLSMGTAWMVIVAVEMLSGGTGIGFFVWDSYNALSITRVIAAIVFIGGIGLALDLLFLRLAKLVAIEEVAA